MATNDERLVLHYRWEFLRRNQDFQKAFDSFHAEFASWFTVRGWWYDPEVKYRKEDRRYLHETIRPIAQRITLQWDIEKLVPYNWHFEKSGKYRLREGVYADLPGRSMETRQGVVVRLNEEDLEFEAQRRSREADIDNGSNGKDVMASILDRTVFISVNIAAPVNFTMSEVEAEIRKARREYRKQHGPLPRQELRPRRRIEQFDEYLNVWDLKDAGLSLAKIAERLHPGEAALERVRDHYRRAKELIGGGYRELE